MNIQPEDQLRRALRSQAERGAPHEIEMDAVTATARGIRRRRTATAALSTAAVVALAVPAGMALTGTFDEDAPPVAGQGPGQEQVEPPETLMEVALLDAEPGADPATLPYVKDGAIVVPGGDPVEVGGQGAAVGVDVVGDRWLVLKRVGEGYLLETTSPAGEVLGSTPARTGPVTSSDRTVAAYVAESGDLRVVTEDGDRAFATADQIGGANEATAVDGSGSCEGDCTVYVETGNGEVRWADASGETGRVDGFRALADVSDGRLLGMVSAADDGSCSALRGGDGEQVWRTCDNSFDAVSPDGRWALGLPAYLDGLGPRSISVVDMADGRERVRFADQTESMSAIFEYAWESDSTLLLTLWNGDDKEWQLLRAGIDGSLSVVDTAPGNDPLAGDGPGISLG